MKTLFYILIALVPTVAFAQIEVPAQFVDSKIVTTLANGKTYSFDGNEYMVVKRKAKVVVAVPSEKGTCTRTQVTSNHHVQKLNRVRLIAGYGPDGFKTSRSTGHAKVSTDNSV